MPDGLQEAEEAFRRALAADDALNEARFRLAQLLSRTGRPEEAGPLFAEFERRNAVDAESTRLLADRRAAARRFLRGGRVREPRALGTGTSGWRCGPPSGS